MERTSAGLALPPPTRVRYLVLAFLCAGATMAYIHRSCIAVPAKTMETDLAISQREMGAIMSAFYLGYALFQLPGGWLGDRLGTRRALFLFVLIWSVATGAMGFFREPVVLYALWMTNGMAQAGIFPSAVSSFARWFPDSERALPSGLLGSFMSVGAVLANLAATGLLVYVSWEQMFMILAIPGVLYAVGFFSWFRDRPREHSWVNQAEIQLIESGMRIPSFQERAIAPIDPNFWERLFAGPGLYLVCGQQFFRAACYIFYVTWFPTYLQEEMRVSKEQAGLLSSLPLVGVILGAPVGGIVIDWIWRRTGSRRLSRKGVGLATVLGSGTFLVLADFTAGLAATVAFITASGFFAGMSGPAGYTATMDLAGNRVATVFSIMNLAGNAGATLLPLVVPYLRWDVVLLFLAALYGAAGILWGTFFILDEEQRQ